MRGSWRQYVFGLSVRLFVCAYIRTLPLTVSCFRKIQVGFSFLVPADLGNPGQRAVKHVCVCVCYRKIIVSLS